MFDEMTKKLVKRKEEMMIAVTNSKYGEFIIQTNRVQWFLVLLIMSRAASRSIRLTEYLERSTLGNLVNCFRICADELLLIESLNLYNNSRNALAHKMYSEKKLTERECEVAIKLGEKILTELQSLSSN